MADDVVLGIRLDADAKGFSGMVRVARRVYPCECGGTPGRVDEDPPGVSADVSSHGVGAQWPMAIAIPNSRINSAAALASSPNSHIRKRTFSALMPVSIASRT